MGKPSKLTIGDITLEISPDMTPEQIQAMISSIAILSKDKANNNQNKKQDKQIKQKTIADPLQIFQKGTWMDKIALFIRNEYHENLEFTVSDIQLGFQSLFKVILEKAAITTYLNRLHDKGYITKTKPLGSRSHKYQATKALLETYPQIELEQLSRTAEKILQ